VSTISGEDQVVAHKNFTPRLIEWLASAARLRDIPSAAYQEHIRSILDNPQAIWSHAFNNQISAAARNILLILYSEAGRCELRDLEPLWKPLNELTAKKCGRPIDHRDYQNALKELDNAFVTYERGAAEFLNPSIRDLIASEVRDFPQIAVDVIASAGRFQQIVTMIDLSRREGYSSIKRELAVNASIVMGSVVRLLRTPHLRWESDSRGRTLGRYIDMTFEHRLVQIGRLADSVGTSELRTLFEKEVRDLSMSYRKGGVDLSAAISLIKAFDEFQELKKGIGAGLQRNLLDSILVGSDSWWADQLIVMIGFSKESPIWTSSDESTLQAALVHYRKSGVDDEMDNCDGTDDCETLRDELTTLGESLGLPFTRELEKLEERIAELERPQPEFGEGDRMGRSYERTIDAAADSDAAIRDVFGALLD
jgi:hypothetical protein